MTTAPIVARDAEGVKDAPSEGPEVVRSGAQVVESAAAAAVDPSAALASMVAVARGQVALQPEEWADALKSVAKGAAAIGTLSPIVARGELAAAKLEDAAAHSAGNHSLGKAGSIAAVELANERYLEAMSKLSDDHAKARARIESDRRLSTEGKRDALEKQAERQAEDFEEKAGQTEQNLDGILLAREAVLHRRLTVEPKELGPAVAEMRALRNSNERSSMLGMLSALSVTEGLRRVVSLIDQGDELALAGIDAFRVLHPGEQETLKVLLRHAEGRVGPRQNFGSDPKRLRQAAELSLLHDLRFRLEIDRHHARRGEASARLQARRAERG